MVPREEGEAQTDGRGAGGAQARLPCGLPERAPEKQERERHPHEAAELVHITVELAREPAVREAGTGEQRRPRSETEVAREQVDEPARQEIVEDEQPLHRGLADAAAWSSDQHDEQVERVKQPGLRLAHERLAREDVRVPEQQDPLLEPERGDIEVGKVRARHVAPGQEREVAEEDFPAGQHGDGDEQDKWAGLTQHGQSRLI